MPKKDANLRANSNDISLIAPGLYTYHAAPDSPDQFRLHLRVEPDGDGILVVNAATVLHLNQTATEFAYYLIQGKDNIQIVDAMSERYNTSRDVLMMDVQRFLDQILYLTRQTDLSPETSIGFEAHTFQKNLTAPMRIDCCLTQRDFTDQSDERLSLNELSTEEWKTVLTMLFKAGIPHVIFFGGEPTLREDLLEILAHVEELGLVSGLVSSDPNLKNPSFLLPLIEAGLDHLTFEMDPTIPEELAGLSNILDQDLFTCVRMPIHPDVNYRELIQNLKDLGVNAFTFTSSDPYFSDQTRQLQDDLIESGIQFVDDMPLSYHPNSTDLNFSLWDPNSHPISNLVVKPDGTLAESVSSQTSFGNLLREDWAALWKKVISGGAA